MTLKLNPDVQNAVESLCSSGRLPHTVILESRSKAARENAALYLACYALCKSEKKPCFECPSCRKVLEGIHPDVIVPEPSKTSKTGIISLKDLRETYLKKAYIAGNDGDTIVYIFNDAEKLLREDSQNTLLKLIEEPPQSILFIFCVENAKLLLSTVRSRAQMLTLNAEDAPDEDDATLAKELAEGVVSLYEMDLMKACVKLSDREHTKEVLRLFEEYLSRSLRFLSGVKTEDAVAKRLSSRLDREKIIALMNVTEDALSKSETNLNRPLFNAWLCSTYRRISWQK